MSWPAYWIEARRGEEMAGAYCKFCDFRCFVYREVIVGGESLWAGHMATCPAGKAHDRRTLGVDADSAHNPMAEPAEKLNSALLDELF